MTKYSKTLTVVLRDDAPLVHCGDTPTYRTISIQLTDEQLACINSKVGRPGEYVDISRLILEPEVKGD